MILSILSKKWGCIIRLKKCLESLCLLAERRSALSKRHDNILQSLTLKLRGANGDRLSKHFFEDTLELFYKIYNKKALAPPYIASQCLYY